MGSGERVIAGRYRLAERLGSGGMGTVWRGEDLVLGREVAVKEITFPPGVSDEEREVLRERVRREARAAAQLDHPGVVTVHDVVEEGGAIYLVMQYLPAHTLSEVVQRDGPLSPKRAAEVGSAVLGALGAAHARGILHRDVKPSNVLLCLPDGEAPSRVVLTDFGIASAPGDSRLTSTGLVLGSPGYISPERARGDVPGPPSDLWSLGATLFTAVEGHPPYDADDPMATLTAVMVGEPAPFVRSGPLQPVLEGLLERDPLRRLTAPDAARALAEVASTPDDDVPTVPSAAVDPEASADTAVLRLPLRPPAGTPVDTPTPAPPAPPAAVPTPRAPVPVRPTRPRPQPRRTSRARQLAWGALPAAALVALSVPVIRAAGDDPAGRAPSAQSSAQPSVPPPASAAAPSRSLPPLPTGADTPDEQLDATIAALEDLTARDPDAAGPASGQALSGLRRVQGLDGGPRRSAAVVTQTEVAALLDAGRLDAGVGGRLQDVLATVARPERLVDLVELVDVDRTAVGPAGPAIFPSLFELDHDVPADGTAAAAAKLLETVQDGARQGRLAPAFAAAAVPMLQELSDPVPYRGLRDLVADADRSPSSIGPARRQVLASLREMTRLPVFPQGNTALELLELVRQDGQVTPAFRDRATPVLTALVR